MDNSKLYDVVLFWDNNNATVKDKEKHANAICKVCNYQAQLAVKIVYEAVDFGKSLVFTTNNLDRAVKIRDDLHLMGLDTHICPIGLTPEKKQ